MVRSTIYIEGGGDSKDLHARCREGFRKLLESSTYRDRMPRLVACGSRNATLRDFAVELKGAHKDDFVAMLLDSEDPLQDLELTWQHLQHRDGWERPAGAGDDQVLFMTTCMETWIVADRSVLQNHYKAALQVSALPPLTDLERRPRDEVIDALCHATRDCRQGYRKGKPSFELLGELSPEVLSANLPSFQRVLRILNDKLKTEPTRRKGR